MTLKLEEGKYYVDVRGRKIGPMSSKYRSGYYKWHGVDTGGAYTALGRYWSDCTSVNDLVSEWVELEVEPKVEPDVLPFGKLTPVEQGELLLARHSGQTIEVHGHYNWGLAFGPAWYDSMSYRIKPKTKMQAEYWVEFSSLGEPIYVHPCDPAHLTKGYGYIVHHPAVEIKE